MKKETKEIKKGDNRWVLIVSVYRMSRGAGWQVFCQCSHPACSWAPLKHLVWRRETPSFTSTVTLINKLEHQETNCFVLSWKVVSTFWISEIIPMTYVHNHSTAIIFWHPRGKSDFCNITSGSSCGEVPHNTVRIFVFIKGNESLSLLPPSFHLSVQ